MDDSLDISTTLEEFYQDCNSNGYSWRTLKAYRSSLGIWMRFLDERGIGNLTEITRECILDYRYYLQAVYRSPKGHPISVSNQAQKLAALKSFFQFCTRTCKVLINPAEQLRLPKIPKTLPRGILTKRQMKKLLRMPDIDTLIGFRDRVILELFYSTGVRRKELVAIKVSDCYLNERRILVIGKGNKQRWVPVGKKVCNILRRYLEQIRPALIKDNIHDYLIVGNLGGALSGRRVYAIVSRYLKRLGVKSDCHGLRHTCATHLLKGKANIRVIQELLGHSSLATTQIYTHVDISDMTRAIDKAHPRKNMDCDQRQ